MFLTRWLRPKHTPSARTAARRSRLVVRGLEERLVMTAGFVDPSFAGDGVVTTSVGVSRSQEAHDVAIYPVAGSADGKVVAVGLTQSTDRGSADFGLVRYNADGSLDSTFGSGGTVVTAVSGADDWANAVAVLADGRLLAAGQSGYDFALVRYNPNGSVDTSFGSKGKALTDITRRSTDCGAAMRVQADGKIIVAGMTRPSGSTGAYAVAVVRYNANGSLDSTFGSGGKVITQVGSGADPTDVWWGNGMDLGIDPQGRIVVAGRTAGDQGHFVARYTSAGQLDSSFGAGGLTLLANADARSVENAALAVQRDGRIVLACDMIDTYYGVHFIRLTQLDNAGRVDSTFGNSGTVEVGVSGNEKGASAVAIDAAGRLVVGGGGDYFLVARFDANGNLDPTYGNGGIGMANELINPDEPVSLALQANGKAVLSGTTRYPMFEVARFLGDDALSAAAAAPTLPASTSPVPNAHPELVAVRPWTAGLADSSFRFGADDVAAGPWSDVQFTPFGITPIRSASGHLTFDHMTGDSLQELIAAWGHDLSGQQKE